MRETSQKFSFSESIGRGLDSLIGIFNPRAGLIRRQSRVAGEMLSRAYPFRGAERNRFNKDWTTSPGSADEDMLFSLPLLRERSRDLVRNDTHAAGIILTMKTNVVGTGMKPQASVDDEALSIDRAAADLYETAAERAFKKWMPHADSQGRMDFFELQDMIEGQILVNGDVIVIERRIEDPIRPYSLCYEVVEADRLVTPRKFASDKDVRQGVRLGLNGEPVGYYISKYHPGDFYFKKYGQDEFIYYPLYNAAGRKQIYHLYEMVRPSQSRGLPLLTPAIRYFYDKARYMEAEMIAARVAACLVAVIKKENPVENILARSTEDAQTGKRLESMSPGRYEYLNEGESIDVINPNRPSSSFEPFINAVLRAVSTSIGLPYELVAKDFSKVNYSSARAALLEARRHFIKRQDWHQRKFLHPVWCALLEEAYLKGDLGQINFYEDMSSWTCARWVSQGWAWVDPLKEAEASTLAIEKGLSTQSREAANQGRDFYDLVDERVRELQYITKQAKKYNVDLFQDPQKQDQPKKASDSQSGNPKDSNPDNSNAQPEDQTVYQGN